VRSLERVWDSNAFSARVGRALLVPLEALYRTAIAGRNRAYDAGWATTHPVALPAISVGNLSVGGTGKTPVSAYLVTELKARGAHPALVLRGYGSDEVMVHARLNSGVPVVVDADRLKAVNRAKLLGADCVVMDDAFQHRRVQRLVDIVLIGAERGIDSVRLLPAGPWREGLVALRRASLILVTRKTIGSAEASDLAARLSVVADAPVGVASLPTDRIVGCSGGAEAALGTLSGKRVLAVAGVGDPESFAGQLRAAGLQVDLRAYRDHYRFSRRDVEEISDAANRYDAVLCTLKDAVKLAPKWPRSAAPMWYVSQRVILELGAEHVDAAVQRVLVARSQS
jgi:tetraacyldisaccharide 4'-kinase